MSSHGALILLNPMFKALPALPAWTDTTLAAAYPSVPYTDGISASNGGGTNVYAIASGNLPPGMAINSATGNITGTPTTLGVYSFTVSVTNAAGTITSEALSITVSVNTFTQSLGAELLVNGDFSAWTGDNPDGWTLTGESGSDPAVSQSAADGSAGTGAARFYSNTNSSPRIQQNVGGSGTLYEWAMTVSSLVSGAVRADFVGSNTVGWTTAGTKTGLQLYAGVTYVSTSSAVSPPHQFVVDQVSVKPIILNPVWTMPNTNGTHTLRFTLPASPVIGQRVELRYRQQDSLNHWAAVIVRNASNTGWDFQLNSVSGGTATNRISVTNVGAVDALRVVTSGSTHTAYTGSGGTYTQRGTTVTNSLHAAQTGITAVYSSAFTAAALTSV